MRFLKAIALSVGLLALALPALAAPPVFNGSLNVPQLGSLIVATPAPAAAANVYSAGDSITFGLGINNQSVNGCSFYTYPSPCYVDQMNSFWGTTKANAGVSHSCLEATTTTGSLCNPTSGFTPLINDWTSSLLPFAGNNSNWFTIMIGTNDVGCAISACNSATGPDAQINVATFKSNLATIVSGLEGAGTPGAQIILGEIPWQNMISSATVSNSNNHLNTLAGTALLESFNFAIAQVAIQYHTRLALTYQAMGMCIPTAYPAQQNPCMTDSAHPNNTGHANLATAFEQATILNSYVALAAYQDNATLNTVVVLTNPYNGTLQTNILSVTTASGSQIGPASSYSTLIMGSAGANTGTAMKIGTTPSTVAGVQGNCFFVGPYSGSTPVDLTVDCGTSGSGDGNVGIAGSLHVLGHTTCSASSGIPCNATITCSISAGTTCNATTTVPATSICSASANASDTTTGTESWYLSLSTNTLTVTARVSASQTTTAAANLTCL